MSVDHLNCVMQCFGDHFLIVRPTVCDFCWAFQLSCSACQRGATLRQVLVDVDFVLIVSVAVALSAPCLGQFVTHVDSIEAHNEYTMSIAVPYPLTKPMASHNVIWCN